MNAPESHDTRRRFRILVVEDDTDMCMLIQRLSAEIACGLDVQFASSVHEAAMWIDDGEHFDLILADFLLADSRNGYELRELCAERSPGSQFAMMSSMPLSLPEIGDAAFLQKPFSPAEGRQFIEARLQAA